MQFVGDGLIYDTAKSELIWDSGPHEHGGEECTVQERVSRWYKTPNGRIFKIDQTKNTEHIWWRTRFRNYSYDFHVYASSAEAASSMQRNYDVEGVSAYQLCGAELINA